MFHPVPDPERLAALAEFAAGAGHEINNPLATIVGRVQQLLKDEADPVRRSALHSIGAQAYRVRDMIGDVMLFARPPHPVPGLLVLAPVLTKTLATFCQEPASSNVTVTTDLAPGCEVWADAAQFAVVLHELLRNAREAMAPTGGEIRIHARLNETEGPRYCELTVSDTGRGFTEHEVRHAFDPFFSGRQAGRGLGFGLCKVFRIAEMHRARLEIDSSQAGPTTVRLIWPSDEASAMLSDE